MVKSQTIELRNMVVVERVIDLPPVLAAAHQSHVTQPAQLMRHRRLAHFELRGKIANIHLPLEQNGDDPKTGRVAECAEQVSQMCRSLIFEYHNKRSSLVDKYMNI